MARTGPPQPGRGPAFPARKRAGEPRQPEDRTRVTTQSVTGSMTAPLDAEQDFAADASDDNMAAFFSTGAGAAEHYHGSSAGGVGQEEQGEQ